MKKTLLATAIAGAIAATGMVATSAQAATVYDQDGTQLIINGRIAMGIEGGGREYDANNNEIDNDPEFVDVFSRLGLSMSHDVTSDLQAFGRIEWRFTGDERNTNQGFNEVRHSYLGLRSDTFGTIQAGNYDSFYNSYVAAPFDVYINRGLELTQATGLLGSDGGGKQARGDSIGYVTPNLEGFTAFISAKHYSDRGEFEAASDGTDVVTQGGVMYEVGPMRLALGYVDDDERGGGNGEVLWGGTAAYDVTDNFSARVAYETRDDGDDGMLGGYDTAAIGASYSMGQWAFNADYYHVNPTTDADSRNAWAAGTYYKVSSNFDVFLELNDANAPSVRDADTRLRDLTDDVYWLTGARYHF